jgi:hypothetical protein
MGGGQGKVAWKEDQGASVGRSARGRKPPPPPAWHNALGIRCGACPLEYLTRGHVLQGLPAALRGAPRGHVRHGGRVHRPGPPDVSTIHLGGTWLVEGGRGRGDTKE